MDVLYTARAHVTGGRDGHATAADGHPDLVLRAPPEMGGPDQPEATNPEELFALGYGACFLSALSVVARQRRISARDFAIDCAVDLRRDGDAFDIAVALHGTLPGVERDTAVELMHAAHGACPYSRATRGNVEVTLHLGDERV